MQIPQDITTISKPLYTKPKIISNMLDIKLIRDKTDEVKNNLKKRINYDTSIIDEILEIDIEWRKTKKDTDELKSKKNFLTKKIPEMKKKGEDINSHLDEIKKLSEDIEKTQNKSCELLEKRDNLLLNVPNMLDNQVPIGADDEENKTIRLFHEKPKFTFKPKDHRELCEKNNWYELDIASKHSGARFYYLKNEIVILQLALYDFVMKKMITKGYTPVEVPPMLRKNSIGKSVSLEDFKEAIYNIEDEDLCLIGTSEHALALLHEGQTLTYKDLPIKYAGISQCFRKEAGVTKDSKGIFRVHNFNKIEQFIFSNDTDSDKFHEEITKNAEEIFSELKLHYRVVDICSGDIGNFASRKFDIEAYIPSQDKYREMVSASNYRDYGARRLNCRYQDEKGELKFVHTLNSTAIAMVRALIAIIEQYQNEDGNVTIPEALRYYFNGRELLKQ